MVLEYCRFGGAPGWRAFDFVHFDGFGAHTQLCSKTKPLALPSSWGPGALPGGAEWLWGGEQGPWRVGAPGVGCV